MRRHRIIPATAVLAAVLVSGGMEAAPAGKVTFEDQVLPVLRNHCLNCHNPDKKKADFDASTYASIMAGGGSGKVLVPEDPQGSLLWRLVTHAEEPAMPPKASRLPENDLELLKKWIEGGLLENSGSKAAVRKPVAQIESTSVSTGRPSGPSPMPNGDLLLEPVVHTQRSGAVASLATSPWAPLCALAAQHQVLLYHTDSLRLEGIIPFPEGFPYVVRFSRSGRLLLIGGGVGGKLGRVALHDVITGRRVGLFGDEFDVVLSADISPDQSRVALGGPGKRVRIYATTTGELLHTISKHTDWITAIQYSPDGVLLATGDRSGGLHLWEAETAGAYGELRASAPKKINDISWRDDSNVLASAAEDGQIHLWDAENMSPIRKWNAHTGGTEMVRYAHDGRLVSAGRDRVIRLWDAAGKQTRQFEGLGDIALVSGISHDGTRVMGGDFQGETRLWNSTNGALAGSFDLNPPTLQTRLQRAQERWASAKTNAVSVPELEKLENEVHRWKVSQFNTRVWAAADQLAVAKADADAAEQHRKDLEHQADSAAEQVKQMHRRIQSLPDRVREVEVELAARTEALESTRNVQVWLVASYRRALVFAEGMGAITDRSGTGHEASAQGMLTQWNECLTRHTRSIRDLRTQVGLVSAERDALLAEMRDAKATLDAGERRARAMAKEAEKGRHLAEKSRLHAKQQEMGFEELEREYRKMKGGG